jgi:hypothetical protein
LQPQLKAVKRDAGTDNCPSPARMDSSPALEDAAN